MPANGAKRPEIKVKISNAFLNTDTKNYIRKCSSSQQSNTELICNNFDASKFEPQVVIAESDDGANGLLKSEKTDENICINGLVNPKPMKKRRKYYKGLTYSFSKNRSRKRRLRDNRSNMKCQNYKSVPDNKMNGGSLIPNTSECSETMKCAEQKLQVDQTINAIQIKSEESVASIETFCESGLDFANESALPSDLNKLQRIGFKNNASSLFCLCRHREPLFVKPPSDVKEIYCQAVDSMDGRIIGCCNTVTVDDDYGCIQLYRASVRIPFLMYCGPHLHRFLCHQCCPACGLFCTQGRFMMCEKGHFYHRSCAVAAVDDITACFHCNLLSKEVTVVFGEHKNPVFLSSQKGQKDIPSAKISFKGSITIAKPEERPVSPPIVPSSSLILAAGNEIPSNGPLNSEKEKYKYRDLYSAAKIGNAEKVLACLAFGLNPNHVFREIMKTTALHVASVGGFISVVHILVQAGAQLNLLDKEQNTPLMLAATNKCNDVVKYFVKAGATVTFKGQDGMTALHLAAKSGNIEACYYLLSNPTTPNDYINSTDDGGWTALVWAAEHNHLDVVLYLLSRHADPLIRDVEHNIALHWSAFGGSAEICETLLNYNSDINCVNAHGDTPLHICARQNMYGCVVLLLARGAHTDIKNSTGLCALSCCVENSDSYNAIKLNMQLKAMTTKYRERTRKILINDITKGYEVNPIQCVNGIDDEEVPKDFIYMTENCFTSNISIDRSITSLQSCTCTDTCSTSSCTCASLSIRSWYTDDGRLSEEFNFLDAPMLFECNPACKCNKITCKNRVVQHGLTGRFQLQKTKERGWGVSTLRMIPKGTYVCEYIGEIISDREADVRENDSYIFDLENKDGETYCIDAHRYGNIARFINHNCTPNVVPVRVFIGHQDLHFPRIAFFAYRDIQPNEELGYDYGEKFWSIKYKAFTCTCTSEKCRYSNSTIQTTLETYKKKLQAGEGYI